MVNLRVFTGYSSFGYRLGMCPVDRLIRFSCLSQFDRASIMVDGSLRLCQAHLSSVAGTVNMASTLQERLLSYEENPMTIKVKVMDEMTE